MSAVARLGGGRAGECSMVLVGEGKVTNVVLLNDHVDGSRDA